jgi:hypothetical protein
LFSFPRQFFSARPLQPEEEGRAQISRCASGAGGRTCQSESGPKGWRGLLAQRTPPMRAAAKRRSQAELGCGVGPRRGVYSERSRGGSQRSAAKGNLGVVEKQKGGSGVFAQRVTWALWWIAFQRCGESDMRRPERHGAMRQLELGVGPKSRRRKSESDPPEARKSAQAPGQYLGYSLQATRLLQMLLDGEPDSDEKHAGRQPGCRSRAGIVEDIWKLDPGGRRRDSSVGSDHIRDLRLGS